MDNAELSKILEQSSVTISQLSAALVSLRPDAEFGRAVKNGNEHYTLKETADILSEKLTADCGKGIGRTELCDILRRINIFSSAGSSWNEPLRPYINDGYFVVKISETPVGKKVTTKVTGKGLEYVMKKLREYFHG
jgi:phage antirepressor YoqD-like protein